MDDEPRILQGVQRQFYNMRLECQMNFLGTGAKALGVFAFVQKQTPMCDAATEIGSHKVFAPLRLASEGR